MTTIYRCLGGHPDEIAALRKARDERNRDGLTRGEGNGDTGSFGPRAAFIATAGSNPAPGTTRGTARPGQPAMPTAPALPGPLSNPLVPGTSRGRECVELCPNCGAELYRDEVDVGIGTMFGPWGCGVCRWSEDPLYDGREDQDPQKDQWGGFWPQGEPLYAMRDHCACCGRWRGPDPEAA